MENFCQKVLKLLGSYTQVFSYCNFGQVIISLRWGSLQMNKFMAKQTKLVEKQHFITSYSKTESIYGKREVVFLSIKNTLQRFRRTLATYVYRRIFVLNGWFPVHIWSHCDRLLNDKNTHICGQLGEHHPILLPYLNHSIFKHHPILLRTASENW